jgi:hypothetical protein
MLGGWVSYKISILLLKISHLLMKFRDGAQAMRNAAPPPIKKKRLVDPITA